MSKHQYRSARRLLRDNGRYALSLMTGQDRQTMQALIDAPADPLAERAEVIALLGYSAHLTKSLIRRPFL